MIGNTRIELEGAISRMMALGNRWAFIFLDDDDQRMLAEAFCKMDCADENLSLTPSITMLSRVRESFIEFRPAVVTATG